MNICRISLGLLRESGCTNAIVQCTRTKGTTRSCEAILDVAIGFDRGEG
jgi:hypothetical protein